jgi:uncharacterized membrane-anchored protein
LLFSGIAQIALATNQEGAAGGIDAAISWGVGTVTGIGAAALVAVLISNPIGIAIVVIGASFGGSMAYDYTISDAVKSTLNTSICTEKTVSTANLTFAKLFCCCCSSFVKLIAILLV